MINDYDGHQKRKEKRVCTQRDSLKAVSKMIMRKQFQSTVTVNITHDTVHCCAPPLLLLLPI